MTTDIIIIGAGMAGTCSAIALAHAGYDVALIDSHAAFPAEFRAEKIGASQMAQFARLGLENVVRAHVETVSNVWVARFGRVVAKAKREEYSFRYADLVNGLRGALPPRVRLIVGRVADLSTGPDKQSVTLAGGERIEARLLVVATGLGDTIRSKVGIERVRLSRAHSLSFGFGLAVKAEDLPFGSLVYYGNGPADRVAYCTIFPTREGMRANLFVYRTVSDDWAKAFRLAPSDMLRTTLPGLARICPDLTITGQVATRSTDLTEATGHRRDGVVLIGDAFSTCCPIPGIGILKVLTDVEQLCAHVPRWFGTDGMSAAKISAFYDDPIKRKCDRQGHKASVYARSIATDTSVRWAVRRLRNATVRRGHAALNDAVQTLLGVKA